MKIGCKGASGKDDRCPLRWPRIPQMWQMAVTMHNQPTRRRDAFEQFYQLVTVSNHASIFARQINLQRMMMAEEHVDLGRGSGGEVSGKGCENLFGDGTMIVLSFGLGCITVERTGVDDHYA